MAPSTVTRWGQDGKIVLEGKRVAVAASLARLDELGVSRLRPDVAARHASEAGATLPQQSATEDAVEGSRTEHKARALHFENASLKLAMALSRGERYYLADVKAEGLALGNLLRAAVERLIDQTAPALAAMEDEADRRRLLARDTAELQRLLGQEFGRALRRLRQAARRDRG